MTSAISSFGTLLQLGDGASTEAFATIAEVLDISGPDLTLDTEEVTSHSSTDGWDEHVATILRGGEVTFDVNFVPAGATHSYAAGLLKDMTDRTLRNFQLVLPDGDTTTWAFSAYVTKFPLSAPVAGALRSSVTLLISGKPTLE